MMMEQQKQHKIRLSSFSVILIMVVLMVIGAAMIPLLNVQLYPSSKHQQISISFSWPGASARVVEAEVTSKLEGVLGTIRGIQNMESESYRDRGVIILDFKKNENIEAIRFEISTLIKYISYASVSSSVIWWSCLYILSIIMATAPSPVTFVAVPKLSITRYNATITA